MPISDKGCVMKNKSKSASLSTKDQNKLNNENNRLRRVGIRLAAIFLVIVFLASECATLLPMD
jgi:hypothetical protein